MAGAAKPALQILSIQTEDVTHLGNFLPAVEQRAAIRVWQPRTQADPPIRVEDADAVIALGSYANPDEDDLHPWLIRERDVLGTALSAGVPTLGICFGGQLLAQAAGGAIRRLPALEVGWRRLEVLDEGAQDPVFSAIPASAAVFEWHEYAFSLPPGATLLARTGDIVQAVRVGPCAWALQFHIEVTLPQLEELIPANRETIEARGADPEALMLESRQQSGPYAEISAQVVERFLAQVAS